MRRVFISQPMKGRDQADIIAERNSVIAVLTRQGFEVMDSMVTDRAPETNSISLWYLGKSLEILSQADAAFFCEGWSGNRGCRIEYEACKAYGIPILGEDIALQAH